MVLFRPPADADKINFEHVSESLSSKVIIDCSNKIKRVGSNNLKIIQLGIGHGWDAYSHSKDTFILQL